QNTAAFPGIEEGCYSSSGTTSSGNLTFNFGASCTVGGKPAVDATGTSAFSAVAVPAAFTVNGDTILTVAGLPASPFVGSTPRMQPTALPATYKISATISGLTGTGLVLQSNGKSGSAIAANATSTVVATGVESETSYLVTVRTQPAGQYCTVANGNG